MCVCVAVMREQPIFCTFAPPAGENYDFLLLRGEFVALFCTKLPCFQLLQEFTVLVVSFQWLTYLHRVCLRSQTLCGSQSDSKRARQKY